MCVLYLRRCSCSPCVRTAPPIPREWMTGIYAVMRNKQHRTSIISLLVPAFKLQLMIYYHDTSLPRFHWAVRFGLVWYSLRLCAFPQVQVLSFRFICSKWPICVSSVIKNTNKRHTTYHTINYNKTGHTKKIIIISVCCSSPLCPYTIWIQQ